MAQLTNKLYIAKNGVIHEVTSYTTQEEGTPLTITGGSCWKVKNNGIDAYIGLWPTSVSGGTLHSHLKIKKDDIEYWVEKYVENNLVITINQSENQIIKVTCNGTVYTSSFSTIYNSTYTATITASTGYIAGTLSSSFGTVTSNITISATPATKRQVTITINQSQNQTIKVTANGVEHTSTFTVDYGTPWTATVVGDTGYNPGTLSNSTGTATSNTTISATAATVKTYTVTINQTPNQTITVTANGQNYTSSFIVNYGTSWTATVTSSTDFNPGTLSASSGTITSNITISASAPSLKTYTLKLNGTTNQIITLKYKNRNSTNTGYESEVTVTSTSSTQSFTVRHGTTWTASITSADVGYNQGTISASSGTVTADTTVSASAASLKAYTLKLNATSNQTITLKYKNRNSTNTGYESEVTKTSTSSAQSFTVRHGTIWTASISPNDGYDAGTLSGTSGTVTSNTTISATNATSNTRTITLPTFSHQHIVVTVNGTEYTGSTITLPYGSQWSARIVADTGYNAGTISGASSGTLTSNITISASDATIKTFTVTVNIPTNAVIKVNNTNATSSKKTFTFNYGDSVTIKAVANSGFEINKITVT